MKILLATIVAFLFFTSANSQIEFGLFAGPQASTAKYRITDKIQQTDHKYGFQFGGMMKVPFDANLYFAPSVFYSMKGYKVAFTEFASPPGPTATDNNTTLHNVELAALLQVDFSNQPGHFFIKFGPSLDFQLFGNEKFNQLSDPPVSRSMKFGYADYGHYSANAIGQFGYETAGGFVIYGHYTFGLANISNTDGGPDIRNRAFGISFGKYFNRKKIIIDTRNIE